MNVSLLNQDTLSSDSCSTLVQGPFDKVYSTAVQLPAAADDVMKGRRQLCLPQLVTSGAGNHVTQLSLSSVKTGAKRETPLILNTSSLIQHLSAPSPQQHSRVVMDNANMASIVFKPTSRGLGVAEITGAEGRGKPSPAIRTNPALFKPSIVLQVAANPAVQKAFDEMYKNMALKNGKVNGENRGQALSSNPATLLAPRARPAPVAGATPAPRALPSDKLLHETLRSRLQKEIDDMYVKAIEQVKTEPSDLRAEDVTGSAAAGSAAAHAPRVANGCHSIQTDDEMLGLIKDEHHAVCGTPMEAPMSNGLGDITGSVDDFDGTDNSSDCTNTPTDEEEYSGGSDASTENSPLPASQLEQQLKSSNSFAKCNKHRRHHSYTDSDLHLALSAIKDGRMRQHEASAKYGVPRATLYDHLNGRVKAVAMQHSTKPRGVKLDVKSALSFAGKGKMASLGAGKVSVQRLGPQVTDLHGHVTNGRRALGVRDDFGRATGVFRTGNRDGYDVTSVRGRPRGSGGGGIGGDRALNRKFKTAGRPKGRALANKNKGRFAKGKVVKKREAAKSLGKPTAARMKPAARAKIHAGAHSLPPGDSGGGGGGGGGGGNVLSINTAANGRVKPPPAPANPSHPVPVTSLVDDPDPFMKGVMGLESTLELGSTGDFSAGLVDSGGLPSWDNFPYQDCLAGMDNSGVGTAIDLTNPLSDLFPALDQGPNPMGRQPRLTSHGLEGACGVWKSIFTD